MNSQSSMSATLSLVHHTHMKDKSLLRSGHMGYCTEWSHSRDANLKITTFTVPTSVLLITTFTVPTSVLGNKVTFQNDQKCRFQIILLRYALSLRIMQSFFLICALLYHNSFQAPAIQILQLSLNSQASTCSHIKNHHIMFFPGINKGC